jgi:hypothetical protein
MVIDQRLDQLLREAIAHKRLFRFGYKGNERIVEPHDYGIQYGIFVCCVGKWAEKAGAVFPDGD